MVSTHMSAATTHLFMLHVHMTPCRVAYLNLTLIYSYALLDYTAMLIARITKLIIVNIIIVID